MTASANTELPSDSELVVPQELTLSTPWLKAVVVYMGAKCEKEMNEFMLLRREYGNDPRKVLKEGREVTACGVNFIRELRRNCLKEVTDYAKCLDDCRGGEMLIPYCRRLQYPLDICVEEKMGIKRPMVGYFSKLHVHESQKEQPPRPEYPRNYSEEFSKVMDELPENYPIKLDNYKRYRPYYNTFTEND
uniref:Uncharacterized protein n=2 Tax=Meloidogyne TaxID=189290 RepID=A0A6V7W9Y1_MELEN|nr:unnamed protein product [Meloidogyne enterolobii]